MVHIKKPTLIIYFILSFTGIALAQPPGEWTWMRGSITAAPAGNFGTQGVPAPTNEPPGLYGPCEWTDLNGNFWLFGGINMNYNSALWKYDVSSNQWTWVKGSNIVNQPGIYGTQGVPSPANNPGARGFASHTWTDNSGNLWLFGGAGYAALGAGKLNDLWKYNIAANEWTWMSGSNTGNNPGVYGTQGVPSPLNVPPARDESSVAWVDNSGNLWLFGGDGYRNDLWKYNISTNQWTWMKGSNITNQIGVYGTLGVPNPANTPGARMVYTKWKDLNGDFWLFGGESNNLPPNSFNDLWKYSVATNEWTWVNGSNTMGSPGNYGSKCVFAATNSPPAGMENRACWTTGNSSCNLRFWFFGGFLYNTSMSTVTTYDALWCYNPATNEWVWVNGSNIFNQPGVYGTKGVSAPSNKPPAMGGSVGWTDNSENLWLFGGVTPGPIGGYRNTLWRYVIDSSCVQLGAGISINIASTPAACSSNNGTATVTATGNPPYAYLWNPGGQTTSVATGLIGGIYAVTITDGSGCTQTATITVGTSGGPTITVSSGTATCNSNNGTATVTITTGSPPYNYGWNPGGQTNATATGLSAGNYSVTVTDATGCTGTQTVSITQTGGPAVTTSTTPQTCTQGGTGSASASGGSAPYTYSWCNGQTTSASTGLSAGSCTVAVTDANGCSTISTVTITSSGNIPIVTTTVTPASCNSNDGSATASATGGSPPYTYLWSNGGTQSQISNLTSQIYSVTITDSNGCTQTATVTITQTGGPTATALSNVTITQGQSATLTASGGGTYLWSNGSTNNPLVVTPSVTTIYCVTVSDANNCTDTACVTVSVLVEPIACTTLSSAEDFFIPNAFSPNGDLENDALKLYYENIACIRTYKFIIYNRWGEKVFETTDPIAEWDGFYLGKPEGTAVFVYYMKATLITGEEITKKGNVSLIK